MSTLPILYIVVPCYNEEKVLPITSGMFLAKLKDLADKKMIHNDSRIMFVNDGSKDSTWDVIKGLSRSDEHFVGIAQSRNRGHQNAVLAGLMEAKAKCDITISIDCDGQDDINAIEDMVKAYASGCDIVYGVRNDRESDTFFKRATAQGYYRLLQLMGIEIVYNHADYRLLSKRVLEELSKFEEVNIFLRGMIPLVGFKSTCVYYKRTERFAGESHYPLKKMLALAFDGITSLSIKPIRMVTAFGGLIAGFSFLNIIYAIIRKLLGYTIVGWTSTICVVCLMGGIQLISLGIIGEYVGKIYLETKRRPRYIISERTEDR